MEENQKTIFHIIILPLHLRLVYYDNTLLQSTLVPKLYYDFIE